MSLRETLNRNPAITTGATLLIIVVAVGFIIYSQWPSNAGAIPTAAFFSSDDGKTWFEDDAKAIPPIMKDGKEAYRAHVYQCPGSEPFVAYLERFTPEAKKALDSLSKASQDADNNQMMQIQGVLQMGQQFKKPGAKDWVNMTDARFGQMMNTMCPDGQTPAERIDP